MATHIQQTHQPHAVVICYPAQGHIGPTMEFSKVLASKGFVVTFVNSEWNLRKLVQANSKIGGRLFQNEALDIRLVGIPDGLPADHGRTTDISQLSEATETTMRREFEKLMEDLMKQDPPVSCIIADVNMFWATDMMVKYGFPKTYFWTARTATYLIYYYLPLLKFHGFLPRNDTNGNDLITCVPGLPPTRVKDLPSFLQDPEDFMYGWWHRMFDFMKGTDWVFVNAFYELERDAFDTMSTKDTVLYPVGPLLPTAFLGNNDPETSKKRVSLYEEDDKCMSWLDTQLPNSVLYVSFGSVAVLTQEQVDELALALEATKVPFLWVIRPDLVEGRKADPPEGFLESTADQGVVTSWVSQLRVLAHGSVGGFLTHCGWNSTLETVCMGVPVLGWPVFAEQRMNCRWMVDELGIGADVEGVEEGFVRREEVQRVVKVVMGSEEGEAMRKRAQKLKEAARNAVMGGRSEANIDAFVQYMKLRMQNNPMGH